MLFQSATSTVSEIGIVSSSAFSSISPFLYLLIGTVLGFYILNKLADIIMGISESNRVNKRADEIIEETRRLTGR